MQLVGPALGRGCWPLVGRAVMRLLAMGPQEVLGLVLAHSQAEPGSGMAGCEAKGSKPDVSLLANGARS